MMKSLRLLLRFVTFVGFLCYLSAPTLGQLPRIRLDGVLPAGGQAGSIVAVTIRGEMSDAATELVFSHPDIEAIQLQDAESEFRVAQRRANQFEVRIGDHVPPGRYEVRALGPAGLSGPRSFIVNGLMHRRFDANGNSHNTPFKMNVGEAIHGQTRGDQRDYYSFPAEQHRPLLVQVFAERIDSPMDAVLSVYDANGQRLHNSRQSLSRDPLLSFAPPHDGEYVLEVSDSTFQGNLAYVVEVSELPWVEAVYPSVLQPGVETELTVYGYNLPGGTPVSGMEASGQLQSAQLHFTPNFDDASPIGNWVSLQPPAAARVAGGFFALPDQYSLAPTVFVAKSDQAVVRETDSTQENPQTVSLPADIAGQFFPRRDRDWYEFEAKKNEPVWLELTTAQLGSPTDPALRVYRKQVQDGQVSYQSVGTADDIEGPPNNRDGRRFYTGTPDIAYRFDPPQDGFYLVSVVDQYNTMQDDPRLTYRLKMSSPEPDYQLIAFADPERFPDDKIARPNGVGLLPGGTSVVRVRMLPEYGFSGEATVAAENLPAGVTANPLLLTSQAPEGLLVLEAARDANPTVTDLRIVGKARESDTLRVASTAAITWGEDNTDQAATQVRITDDLQIAVLDMKACPVRLDSTTVNLATCRGAKTPLVLTLDRREDFKDVEVSVAAVQAPGGLKIEEKKSKTDTVEMVLECTDGKLAPGRYTVVLGSKLKDKRPKNTVRLVEAQGDLDKVSTLQTTVEQQQSAQQESSQQANATVQASTKAVEAVQSRAAEPRNQLTNNLQQQLAAAQALQSTLQQAIDNPANAELVAKIADLEKQLVQRSEQRGPLQAQLGTLLTELEQMQAKLRDDQTKAKQAADELTGLNQRLDAVKKEKEAATKRLQDTEKAQLADAEFWVFAKTITVDVASTPITLHAKDVTAKQGSSVDIPVFVQRQFGFADQITVEAEMPSGLTATPVVLGAGSDAGKLTVHIGKDVPVQRHSIKLRVKAKFNGVDIDDRLRSLLIDVTPQE